MYFMYMWLISCVISICMIHLVLVSGHWKMFSVKEWTDILR